MLGQILVEIDIEVDVGWTWRGVRHLSVDVFALEYILIEQSVLGQILVEIDIEVDVGLTWRGMVEIVLSVIRSSMTQKTGDLCITLVSQNNCISK